MVTAGYELKLGLGRLLVRYSARPLTCQASAEGRRHQRLFGGAAKDAAFHQSIDAPHGAKPNRALTRPTHRNARAACGSLAMHRGTDLP
jgi:hypothetical protein